MIIVVTLADVRVLVQRHLPEVYRDRPHWRAVARDLEAAVAGDTEAVVMSLRFAFLVEGIAGRPPLGRVE